MSEFRIKEICMVGKGADCCRYLLMGPNGWECGKLNPREKEILDANVKAGRMVARGNNCMGFQFDKEN